MNPCIYILMCPAVLTKMGCICVLKLNMGIIFAGMRKVAAGHYSSYVYPGHLPVVMQTMLLMFCCI